MALVILADERAGCPVVRLMIDLMLATVEN